MWRNFLTITQQLTAAPLASFEATAAQPPRDTALQIRYIIPADSYGQEQ